KTAIGDGEVLDRYEEVSFCGAGEATLRLDVVIEIAKWLKKKGLRVRLNTNGQGNLVNKRNILPELKGLVDSLSISLNAPDAKTYKKISQPEDKQAAFPAVLEFAREAKQYVPKIIMTAVAVPEVDLEACRRLAEDELDIPFLVREFEPVE
ncbi:MAG: TatD family nuclease-associated radical SAM protein, partial [bacterium]